MSFSGVGRDAVQGEEFRRTAALDDRSAVFVTDKLRSWYNAPGVYERILEEVGPHAERAASVATLGNSMGAFGALLFAAPLKAGIALAFGPQVSVSRKVVPKERRWSQFTSNIAQMRFEHVSDHMTGDGQYVVIHGSGGKDAFHIRAFRPQPNLHHFIIPGGRHSIATWLKEKGLLAQVIDLGFAGDLTAMEAAIRAVGGVRREEAGDVMAHFEARRAERKARRAAEAAAQGGASD